MTPKDLATYLQMVGAYPITINDEQELIDLIEKLQRNIKTAEPIRINDILN